MIVLWTGAPGSGKTYSAIALIMGALEDGLDVATNIELVEGWALTAARANPFRRVIPGRCRRVAADWESRILISDDLDVLFKARTHGRKEGSLRVVLDEAHNWVNARTWDSDGGQGGKQEAVGRRLRVVRYFSQHRKVKADVYLITQSAESIDAQIRRLFEFHVTLRNLKRFRAWGVPLVPFNLFLAIWRWNDPGKSVSRRQMFRLRRRYARLYDTLALSHGEEDDGELIYLGRTPCGHRPSAKAAEAPERSHGGAGGSPPVVPSLKPARRLAGLPRAQRDQSPPTPAASSMPPPGDPPDLAA